MPINITNETDSTEENGAKEQHSGNTRLPFGLCKKYHIGLPDNATPRDAWNALREGVGITPDQAYAELKKEKNNSTKTATKNAEQEAINAKEIEAQKRVAAIEKMLDSDRIKETRTFNKRRIKENLSYGTEEMQSATANLFNDDSFKYENRKEKGTFYSPLGNRVAYKMENDGGEGSVYSKGGVFYHETWHAIDTNYGANGEALSKNYILKNGGTLEDMVFKDTSAVDWEQVKNEIQTERELAREKAGYSKEKSDKIDNAYREKIKEWHALPAPHPAYNVYIEQSEEYKAVLEKSKVMKEIDNALSRKWGDLSDFYSGYMRSAYGLFGLGHDRSYWTVSGRRAKEAFAECASAKATNPESYTVLTKYVPNVVKGFEEIFDELKNGRIKANV